MSLYYASIFPRGVGWSTAHEPVAGRIIEPNLSPALAITRMELSFARTTKDRERSQTKNHPRWG